MTLHDDIRALLLVGKSASAIAKIVHKRKQNVLAIVRELLQKPACPAPKKFTPKKYKRVLKVFCYRDWMLPMERNSGQVGCNLYFILYLREKDEPTTRDIDYFDDVRDFFQEELEKSGFGLSGDLEYERSKLSECEIDDIETATPSGNYDQFVFEINDDFRRAVADITYYGWFAQGMWEVWPKVWTEFDLPKLQILLIKRFSR